MAAKSTSFIQFDYCNLCKLSHKKQKKHLYSKRHQEILQNILKKYSKKIKDAKKCLNNPNIEPLGWEVGAQFWCYFCEMEINKHRAEEDATVKYGGLLQHIASNEHVKKTGEFFWKNIIDMKKKPDYILSKVVAERFSNKSDTALTLYRQKMKATIQQMADKIRKQTSFQDQFKKNLVKAPPWAQMCTKQTQISQHASSTHVSPTVTSNTSGVPRKKTIQAKGPGLTSIIRPTVQTESSGEKEEVENVFTGATPPWLREEEQEEVGGVIGPSLTEYDKHLEREKKKKLPANRVGAKFDHTSQTSANWMPSFGGVWNQGRRLNAKIQFDKRLGTKGQQTEMMQSARASMPTTVVPYKRKNKSESNQPLIHLISSPLVDSQPANMRTDQGIYNIKPQQTVGFTGYTDIHAVVTPWQHVDNRKTSVPYVSSSVVDFSTAPAIQSEPMVTHSQNITKSVSLSSVPIRVHQVNAKKSESNMVDQKPGTPSQGNGELGNNQLTSKTVTRKDFHQTISENLKTVTDSMSKSMPGVQPGVGSDIKSAVNSSDTKDSAIQSKRPLPPSQLINVVPYKRKKKEVPPQGASERLGSSRDTPGADVGQMFTQACDMAFTQQTPMRGTSQAYPQSYHSNHNICYHSNQNVSYHSNQNVGYHSNQNIGYYRNQNIGYQNKQNQYHYPQWTPQTVPRQQFIPQYSNNSSQAHYGQTRPHFMHSQYPQPPIHPSINTGLAQPPVPQPRLATPSSGVAKSSAPSGGLNLFQSISAAIGSKLPNQ